MCCYRGFVSHVGVVITRYKKVHDGNTAYQQTKNMSPSNKMVSFEYEVVWIIPTGNHCRNKMEPPHPFGVFVGIVPRTEEFVALTPQGAALVCTVRRFSEEKRWDAECVSQVGDTP